MERHECLCGGGVRVWVGVCGAMAGRGGFPTALPYSCQKPCMQECCACRIQTGACACAL